MLGSSSKPRPTCLDGLPVSAFLAFCRKVLVRRDRMCSKEDENFTIIHEHFKIYIYVVYVCFIFNIQHFHSVHITGKRVFCVSPFQVAKPPEFQINRSTCRRGGNLVYVCVLQNWTHILGDKLLGFSVEQFFAAAKGLNRSSFYPLTPSTPQCPR